MSVVASPPRYTLVRNYNICEPLK